MDRESHRKQQVGTLSLVVFFGLTEHHAETPAKREDQVVAPQLSELAGFHPSLLLPSLTDKQNDKYLVKNYIW